MAFTVADTLSFESEFTKMRVKRWADRLEVSLDKRRPKDGWPVGYYIELGDDDAKALRDWLNENVR